MFSVMRPKPDLLEIGPNEAIARQKPKLDLTKSSYAVLGAINPVGPAAAKSCAKTSRLQSCDVNGATTTARELGSESLLNASPLSCGSSRNCFAYRDHW